MRVSEGVHSGRFAELYNPEIFQEHESVIVFTRDDINRTYRSIMEQIDQINKISFQVDEEWKLIGYWPKIMERVNLIDIEMDLIFEKENLQSYLDVYIYSDIQSSQNITVSDNKALAKINVPNLNL